MVEYILCGIIGLAIGAIMVVVYTAELLLSPTKKAEVTTTTGGSMKAQLQKFLELLAARLSEQSTWQGIGFLLTLSGAKLGAGMDWGQAAGLGGIVSAVLKMVFPEEKKP